MNESSRWPRPLRPLRRFLWWLLGRFKVLKSSCQTSLGCLRSLILKVCLLHWLSLKGSYLGWRTSVEWTISSEEYRLLTSLIGSAGWSVLQAKQRLLLREAEEYLMAAGTERELMLRKGYLQGLQSAISLAEHLIEVHVKGRSGLLAELDRKVDEQLLQLLERRLV